MNFNVAMPEVNKSAYLSFDFDAMQALHKKHGDDYVSEIVKGLDRNDVKVFDHCLQHMMKEADETTAQVIDKMTLRELSTRIADALSLRINGKTFEEHSKQAAEMVNAANSAI